jgi:hypothetical protein
MHVFMPVQALWSLQAVPFGAAPEMVHAPAEVHEPRLHSGIPTVQWVPTGAVCELQIPVMESHFPTWHPTSSDEQSFGVPPAQLPFTHVLLVLQRSPVRTHALPSLVGSGVPTHLPVLESQAVVLHSLSGENEQSFGVPTHFPT